MKIHIPEPTDLVMEGGDNELKQELLDLFNHSTLVHLEDIIQAHWKWQKREYKREH